MLQRRELGRQLPLRGPLKALEADIHHANTMADAIQRNYGGACVQMRLSWSSLAPLLLYLIQWLDCGCCYALPRYLGLFHILICKVYAEGDSSVSTYERRASLREFYAIIYPILQQLESSLIDRDLKGKGRCKDIVSRKRMEDWRTLNNKDVEREDECGICMETCTKMVLPNCSHAMCMKCYRDWYSRSESCPFCRGSLKRIRSRDLWVLTNHNDVIDPVTLERENGCLQKFGWSAGVENFCLKMANYGTYKAFNFRYFASSGRGFGADSTNKRKIKSKKRPKDVALEPSKVPSGDSMNRDQRAPELRIGRENKSGKSVMDKQFLEKVEAVRRSAIEKKKAEENKSYQAIDYDAPVESDKSTIGFGTRVGVGIAVVVFGLVFAFGDFLPYGSVSPSKESAMVNKKLSEEEKENFKRALEGFEATLSKSPNDPTALEGAAVSLVELGEYQKASDLLEKLVKVIPDKAEAYRLLGEVKFELKDYEGSSSSYRNSLSSSDNIDFDVLRGLANSLLAAKKPDQAVEVILLCRQKLNEKSQTRPADLEAANNNGAQKSQDIDPIQVDLLLGKAYSDWGHISDAVAVYDKLITEHPEDFRGYLAKGIILRDNGKAGDAERMFIQAKFFAPEAAKALVDRYAQR